MILEQDEKGMERKMTAGDGKLILSDYISSSAVETDARVPLFHLEEGQPPLETGLITVHIKWTPDPVPDEYEPPLFD